MTMMYVYFNAEFHILVHAFSTISLIVLTGDSFFPLIHNPVMSEGKLK